MQQVKLIVSNWKMNLGNKKAARLVNNIKKLKNIHPNYKNIICPQFLLIPHISNLVNKSSVLLGAQDCHYQKEGAYTGDTSIELLKENKCKYIIVGHSERRQYHKENDSIIRKKVDLVLSKKIKPIVCVGELLKERQSKRYVKIIKNQLDICIPKNLNNIVIAYEPVWSIGTGLVPSLKEINEIYQLTKIFLQKSKKIHNFYFLYGGSVNSKNFKEIIENTSVDGALIGGASLKFSEMKKILTNS